MTGGRKGNRYEAEVAEYKGKGVERGSESKEDGENASGRKEGKEKKKNPSARESSDSL